MNLINTVSFFLKIRTVRETSLSKNALIHNFFDFKALRNLQAIQTVKAVHM